MTDQIVLAFKPSNLLKDWYCGADGDGNWFYEQRTRFYDTAHNGLCAGGFSNCAKRAVGKEPYFNLNTKKITNPPRIYITHHPKQGEWEKLKTIDDLKASKLFKEDLR